MSRWRQLSRGLRNLLQRSQADKDIGDEIEFYLDEAAADFEARGLSPDDARRAARLEMGGVVSAREQIRGYGWENIVDSVWDDLRYGARRMWRSPAFTFVGALTLALGIGASTVIFSAVNAVLVQPLPYPDAARLMMIWDGPDRARSEVTFGTYREIVERSRSFESVAVVKPLQVTLTGVDEPERLDGHYVSASYFRTLGVRPALGRDFQESEDRPRAPFVALITDGLWRRRFGADGTMIGRQIRLNDIPVTVIGILPADFENVVSPSAEVFATLQYDATLPLNGREWGRHLRMIGRLRPDANQRLAQAELDTIARTPLPAFPRPQVAALSNGLVMLSLQDDLTGTIRPVLMVVLAAVFLLLAIACVNVTHLLLARGVQRRSELAVRASLGASRRRLVRQLLTESLLLAALGGVCGTIVAYTAVQALLAVSPPDLPRAHVIAVDRWALVFALGLTSLVGVVIGLVPSLHGPGRDLLGGIQSRSMRLAGGHHRTRRSLVVVQVALAVVLLVGAGLLLRSLQQLFAVSVGFAPAHLLTLQVQTAGQRFRDAGTTHLFFTQVIDAVRQLPGVTGAGFTSQLPLTGDEDVWGVHFESVPKAAAKEDHDGYRYAVSPGYLEAMGIPLRKGRLLSERDDDRSPQVAVINESFARRRLPGLDPIGQRLHVGPNEGPWFTVVGVVGDVKQMSLSVTRADGVYMTAPQWKIFPDNARWLVVRTTGDPAAMTPAIRRAIKSVDGNQPILRIATMDERVKASEARRRFALILFEVFGVVALILAAIGVYSLVAGSVTERTREIGVRTALGASRQSIVTLVLGQGMRMVGTGIVIGLAAASIASGTLQTLLFGISRLDSTTYAGVLTLLTAVSVIACALPAWRAARIRPSVALMSE